MRASCWHRWEPPSRYLPCSTHTILHLSRRCTHCPEHVPCGHEPKSPPHHPPLAFGCAEPDQCPSTCQQGTRQERPQCKHWSAVELGQRSQLGQGREGKQGGAVGWSDLGVHDSRGLAHQVRPRVRHRGGGGADSSPARHGTARVHQTADAGPSPGEHGGACAQQQPDAGPRLGGQGCARVRHTLPPANGLADLGLSMVARSHSRSITPTV